MFSGAGFFGDRPTAESGLDGDPVRPADLDGECCVHSASAPGRVVFLNGDVPVDLVLDLFGDRAEPSNDNDHWAGLSYARVSASFTSADRLRRRNKINRYRRAKRRNSTRAWSTASETRLRPRDNAHLSVRPPVPAAILVRGADSFFVISLSCC